MKIIHEKIITKLMFLTVIFFTVGFISCEDSKTEPVGDPQFENYSPQSGQGGSEIMIKGNHFGESISDAQVWINGVEAKVVNVTQTRIYAIIPQAAGSGTVKIVVKGKEFNPENPFIFEYVRNVSTYSGSGTAVSVDGALRQASFNRPYWLAYDKKDNALFVLEEDRKIRRIKDGNVETVASLYGSINNPRSITMSISCDTLFIGNDNGGDSNNVTVAILTRDDDFRVQKDLVKSQNDTKHVNFAGIHPISGDLIFYCWPRKLYKWNKENDKVELLYDLARFSDITADFYANFCFSPDGTTMYLVIKYPYIGILKANYDMSSKSIVGGFEKLAGTGSWGANDGTGEEASFDQPAQSVVDQNGNIYIAEKFNHWVRLVSPTGVVTRYAGDGGAGNQGFGDGDMYNAKFNEPEGITFDNDGNMYVADMQNSRIRIIKNE